MRDTRYETVLVEQRKTVQTLTCDVDGTTVDVVPLTRPEGWVFLAYEAEPRVNLDFCSWACFMGWINAREEENGVQS